MSIAKKKNNYLYHQKNTTNNFIHGLRQLKVSFPMATRLPTKQYNIFSAFPTASQVSEYNKVDASPENLLNIC